MSPAWFRPGWLKVRNHLCSVMDPLRFTVWCQDVRRRKTLWTLSPRPGERKRAAVTSPETFCERFRFSWGVCGDAGHRSVLSLRGCGPELRLVTWICHVFVVDLLLCNDVSAHSFTFFFLFSCRVGSESDLPPVVSVGCCAGLQSLDIIWVFLLWLLNTRLFVLKWKCFSLYSPRNQPDNSSTLLHLSASRLLFVPSASPFQATSPLICLHPSSPSSYTCRERGLPTASTAGMISLDSFIIWNWRGSGASAPQTCLLLIQSGVSGFSSECPTTALPPPGAFG